MFAVSCRLTRRSRVCRDVVIAMLLRSDNQMTYDMYLGFSRGV
jgi:hypothetical protein